MSPNKVYFSKIPMNINVLDAAKLRISWVFDTFDKIIVSFSGGKDSTCMLHLVMEEAQKRNRQVYVMFIDWEIQFQHTINHVKHMFDIYKKWIIPYWICLPFVSDNTCSCFEPEWKSWDNTKKELWVRDMPSWSISNPKLIPVWYDNITFEEFTPKFAAMISENGKYLTADLIGIRTVESLNRFRAIASVKKNRFKDKIYTTCVSENVYNVYPIYDWQPEDDWTYITRYNKCYNTLYDVFYRAGLTISQMRVDEIFGLASKRVLPVFQAIEPDTWSKILLRISGANVGKIYGNTRGNILGLNDILLPDGYTWEKFCKFILSTLPQNTCEHYKNKFAVYIHYYQTKNIFMNDAYPSKQNKHPSWQALTKAVLRNDFWCKTIGFAPTLKSNYEEYTRLIKEKRKEWGIFDEKNS